MCGFYLSKPSCRLLVYAYTVPREFRVSVGFRTRQCCARRTARFGIVPDGRDSRFNRFIGIARLRLTASFGCVKLSRLRSRRFALAAAPGSLGSHAGAGL